MEKYLVSQQYVTALKSVEAVQKAVGVLRAVGAERKVILTSKENMSFVITVLTDLDCLSEFEVVGAKHYLKRG